MWSHNLKILTPKAEPSLNSLRILGKLDGPLAATLLIVLEGIEKDLSELLADTTDNRLYGQVIT